MTNEARPHTKADAARRALELLEGPRQKDYGDPREDFERASRLFHEMSGMRIDPEDIPLFMIAIKLSRERHRPKPDNMVDVIGYASIRVHLMEGRALAQMKAMQADDTPDLLQPGPATVGQRLVQAMHEALSWIIERGLEDEGLNAEPDDLAKHPLIEAAHALEDHLLSFDGLLEGPQDKAHAVFWQLSKLRQQAQGVDEDPDVTIEAAV